MGVLEGNSEVRYRQETWKAATQAQELGMKSSVAVAASVQL